MDRTKTIRKLVISLTAGVLGMLAVNVFSAVYPEKVEHFIETEKEPEQMTAWWGRCIQSSVFRIFRKVQKERI